MFRIGTTSYIVPDEILPNVEYLAPLVDDIQLVLFETDDQGSNLPDAQTIDRLCRAAIDHDLTYTVHLPLDLRLAGGGSDGDVSILKARRVVEATRALDPHAYTLHLDGRELVDSPDAGVLARWQEDGRRALEIVCSWLDEPDRVCVENVEGWDPEAFAPVVIGSQAGRTIDVGHLWLQGVDPLDHLTRWLHRTRVIHLHGIATRDHVSLGHVPAERLDPVITLLATEFTGVVTLEVFSVEDLRGSLEALARSLERIAGGDPCLRS